MSTNMNTPPVLFRPSLPYHPRRTNTTPSQRPKTSSGETIEPRSDFLRDALREKKGLPPRSQSTTPRRARAGFRSSAYDNAQDEWMPSSDEEKKALRRSAARPQRTRRASDIGTLKSSLSPNGALGTRETGFKLDKLEKENFDLKLKITLQQERVNKLHEDLEQALGSMQDLNNALELLSRKVATSEEELEKCQVSNHDLTELNDELLKELEQRDEGIKMRQLAIEEAAGIIQTLEIRCEALEQASSLPAVSPRPESDYFSGDAEVTSPKCTLLKPPAKPGLLNVLPTPPDSDYFSADTSPNLTPRTPRFASMDKTAQLERARAKGAQFNKELGLRSAASKDSLLSSFIDTPSLPPVSNPARILRRKTPTPTPGLRSSPKASVQATPVTLNSRTDTPPWSDSRPLRSLYEQGEFNRRINASTPLRHTNTTPSVTVGTASNSFDDIFSTLGATQAHTIAITGSDPTATPSQRQPQTQPQIQTPPTLQQQQQQQQQQQKQQQQQQQQANTQLRSNLSPVNYNNWPRKYPEWPPSLGLRHRDILFHGDGMQEMFPVSSPRNTYSNTNGTLTLQRSNTMATPQSTSASTTPQHQSITHLRSSSVTPMGELGLPPTLKRGLSHRNTASLSVGRPREPERRKSTFR